MNRRGWGFGVLGPLLAQRNGEPVPVSASRSQSTLLVALLAASGQPLSRDQLMDELWPEQPPASAVSAFHVHMSKLRASLDGLLVLGSSGYQLDPAAYDLDARDFEELLERARRHPAEAGVLLRQALGLFRGEPLSNLPAEGRAGEWRRSLEDGRLVATEMRIDADLAAGAHRELVPELERLLAQHPFSERLWGQFILALYRDGRQADALDAYSRLRRSMSSELGLEPGEQLTQLQRRILDRDPTLLPAADPSVAPPRRPRGSPIPSSPTPLLGRDRELAAVIELLGAPETRLVTVTGPGGVGKTRLLLEVARRLEDHHADGALFVRLEGLSEPALVTSEIAGGVARLDRIDSLPADALAESLRDRDLLLVLDNFEQLLPAAAAVADLIAETTRIQVLVSSRTPLQLPAETVFELEPLALPGGENDADIAASPAVQLFLRCARAVNRDIVLDPPATRAVADICRGLDGMPLAIELAAARSRALTPAEIAGQLGRPLSIGAGAIRDLPERQQTLTSTIRWSYELLSATAAQTLCLASVFAAGFSVDALQAIAGRPVAEDIDELLAASLLRRQLGGGRYETFVLVSAFGVDMLGGGTALVAARDRHLAYFAAMAGAASDDWSADGPERAITARIRPDHANLRRALDHAVATGDGKDALAIAMGLRALWFASMNYTEASEVLSTVLGQGFAVPGGTELRLIAAVAFVSPAAYKSGWYKRLADRADQLGDQAIAATARVNLFAAATNSHDLGLMREMRPSLHAQLDADLPPKVKGWITYMLTLDAYAHGDLDIACQHADAAYALAERNTEDYLLAATAGNRVLTHSARDAVTTHAELTHAVEIISRSDVPTLLAVGLWHIARYAAPVDPAAAARWLAYAERILAGVEGDPWPENELRTETLAVLGLTTVPAVPDEATAFDAVEMFKQAHAWLATRDPSEVVPRVMTAPADRSGDQAAPAA